MDIWEQDRIKEYIEDCLCTEQYTIEYTDRYITVRIELPVKIHINDELLEHIRSIYYNLGWKHILRIGVYSMAYQRTVESLYLMTERLDI